MWCTGRVAPTVAGTACCRPEQPDLAAVTVWVSVLFFFAVACRAVFSDCSALGRSLGKLGKMMLQPADVRRCSLGPGWNVDRKPRRC